jgi:hypothetical protein
VLPNFGSKKLRIIVNFFFFFFLFSLGLVLQLVSVFFPNKLRTFLGTYKEKKKICFIFSWVFVFLQLVMFFNFLYFLPKEIPILVHIFLGGLRVTVFLPNKLRSFLVARKK